MSPVVFLNGAFTPAESAQVSVFDGGLLHGAGLFETMRAEHGRVFRLQDHLDRLLSSSERILRPLARKDLPDDGVFTELLERNKLQRARIRLTVTAGSMLLLSDEDENGVPPLTISITCADLGGATDARYTDGASVSICDFRQAKSDPLSGHKSTSYVSRLIGLREAQHRNCAETLWFNVHNHLAEGSISNVFLIKDDVLQTPPLDTPVLPGIARSAVLELGKAAHVECSESPLTLDDLLGADEVFLTNVIMQVMPVIRIEKHEVGDGRVGPNVKRLQQRFKELVQQECQS